MIEYKKAAVVDETRVKFCFCVTGIRRVYLGGEIKAALVSINVVLGYGV